MASGWRGPGTPPLPISGSMRYRAANAAFSRPSAWRGLLPAECFGGNRENGCRARGRLVVHQDEISGDLHRPYHVVVATSEESGQKKQRQVPYACDPHLSRPTLLDGVSRRQRATPPGGPFPAISGKGRRSSRLSNSGASRSDGRCPGGRSRRIAPPPPGLPFRL